jgi:hypothetical protein
MKAYSGTQDGRDSSHSQAGRSIERVSEANITAIRCKMLRLKVVVSLDANLEVSGAFGEGLLVSNLELAPGFQEDLARHRI